MSGFMWKTPFDGKEKPMIWGKKKTNNPDI